MNTLNTRGMFAALIFAAVCIAAAGMRSLDLPLNSIQLPPGFTISTFASGVKNARSMALGSNGTVFVGTRDAGNVYALVDHNHTGHADEIITIARGLNMPNGVAFRDGALYVAEINRILRYDNIECCLKNPRKPEVVSTSFPSDRHHGWKFLAFGPDNMLYTNVGAPCNVCMVSDPYASIMRMNADGSHLEVFARGVRNTVGFDWNPLTKVLWFTDNGIDYLGDDTPPDELNIATERNMNFGFPKCHGKDILDPRFGTTGDCDKSTPPALELPAHVAPLGMRFYTGSMFPPEYQNQIFIAEHGSWNRPVPTGYSVIVVRVENNKPVKWEPFAQGWLQAGRAWGRPVDVQVMPDGSLLVSDDTANAIYRITYKS
jgi:glucose/arabinose dehydrogenase